MSMKQLLRWRIGDVTVTRIEESVNPVDRDHLLPMVTDELLEPYRAAYTPTFLDEDGRLILSIHGLLVEAAGMGILVDTCIGDRQQAGMRERPPSPFLDNLVAAGYPAESIDVVLCTHLHFDHVGWNTQRVNGKWVPTFPQARYLFGKQEYDHWTHLRDTGGYHDVEHLHDSIDPVIQAGLVDFIGPDHPITDEVSLFPTPGHTPGHVSVLIRSRGEEAVITGDLMHHPIQLSYPQRHANFDMDKEQGARTRQAFVDRFGGRRVLVIGSHFSDPTAGWIVRDGDSWILKT